MLTKILPGMVDDAVEFFKDDEGKVKYIHQGKVNCVSELPYWLTKIITEHIELNPEINNHLLNFHPDSEIKRLHQFINCRFGGIDFRGDIVDGKLQESEYIHCPLRGNCKSEGVLCKMPVVNGHTLTPTEVKIIQMSTTDMTNDVIAEECSLPLGSFHKIKQNIYDKFCVPTKQCLTKLAYSLNLI